MVEQMVSSNLSKYGLGKTPTIITTPDNPPLPPVTAKDTTVKNMQNPPVATKGKTVKDVQNVQNPAAAAKDTTVKNVQNDNKTGTIGPVEPKSPPGGSNVNNHNLVYARRKSDGEQLGDKRRSPQKGNDGVQSFANIAVNSVIRNSENEESGVGNLSAMEHWNSRFVKLQKYLKQCDSSNHEVYLQELRSFSPDECSRHAVELERRAIQLVVEEGREIQRVKDLNILGKSAGNHLLLRQPIPIFKSEKLV